MGTGYTRNDTSNNIADGNVINASDLDGEYDAIESAFGTSGHTHDGTSGEGGPVTVLGPVQDFVASASEIKPKTDNTLDIGTSSLEFKDLYLDGLAYIDGLGETMLVSGSSAIQFRDTAISINSSTDGQLDIDADTEIEITSPTVDINASTVVNISTDLIVGDDLTLQSDAAVLNFGADSDVSLTHVADTGLLLNAGSAIQFRDSALAINSSTDGQLDIIADTQLEITTPTLELNSDSQIIAIGADGDVTITHEADTGLKMKAASGFELNLQTGDTSVESGNVLGKITFNAPSESSGSDALLDGAAIEAVAEATFASDNNSTALVFKTNTSAAATERMRLKSDGTLNLLTNADFDGDLDVDGTTNLDVVDIDGAVDMASTLQVDGAITSSSGATITTADNSTQLKLVSTDTDASVGPKLDLHRNSANPAADDIIGVIRFIGEDSDSNEQEYAKIRAHIIDPTSGSEDTKFVIQTQTGGAGFERLMFSPTETNFNDDGGNIDFRVESDTNANMLFVDAGNNCVNIGTTNNHGGLLNVQTSDNSANLVLSCIDTDASSGPVLELTRDNSSAADSDEIGVIRFKADNSANSLHTYANIGVTLGDVTDGTEDGTLNIQTIMAGTSRDRMTIRSSGVVFNEESQDTDFRVESDNSANMIFVDASADAVGIAKSAPTFGLDVGVPMRVITSDNTSQLVLESTDADANKGPAIDFFRNSASPNDSDAMGRINFQGKDEGGNTTTYAKIESSISDSSEGTEDGQLTFTTLVGGSDAQRFGIFRTGTIINQDAANVDLRVESTANANMLFVDAGNDRIGIGTNAPDFILHVQGETAGSGSATTVFKLDQPASSLSAKNEIRSGVISGTNPYLAFAVRESGSPFATVERLRIDQDGDILIGDEQTSIHGGGVGASNTYLQVHGSSGNAGVVNLGRSTSTDNQSLGELRFYNSNNADDNNNDADGVIVGVIQARSETSDSNAGDDSGGHIIFSTKSEGGSLAERVRISSNGHIGVGTTSNSFPLVISTGAESAQLQLARPTDGSQRSIALFRSSSQGANVGEINVTNTATTYGSTSDYRLKENVIYDWDATTRLKKLKPARFNFIAESDETVDGFLAHEVQSVVPQAVSGTHNEVDDDGNPVHQSMDASKLVPLLVKTIQELEARIAKLEGE